MRIWTPQRPTLLLMLGLALVACGESAEPRVRIELEVLATGRSAAFTTEEGWSVEIDAARLHLETLRFFEGSALVGVPRRFTLIPSAGAHPGHYTPGEALADVVTPTDLELLAAEPTRLVGDGVSGHFQLAELHLSPSLGLARRTAAAQGRAQKDGHTLRFSVSTDLDTTVRGVALDVHAGGPLRLRLELDLAQWLGRVDFDALQSGTSSVTLQPGSQGHNAFLRGVSSTAAFIIQKESSP